jgi:hypothetical protein
LLEQSVFPAGNELIEIVTVVAVVNMVVLRVICMLSMIVSIIVSMIIVSMIVSIMVSVIVSVMVSIIAIVVFINVILVNVNHFSKCQKQKEKAARTNAGQAANQEERMSAMESRESWCSRRKDRNMRLLPKW